MPRYLALDWDQNQLHIVAANIRGSAVKMERASVSMEEIPPPSGNPETLGKLLRERLKSAGIAPAPIIACIGRDRVILKDIRFPNVPEAEEPNVIRFQAVKELTDPPDEVIIDYASVSDRGAPEQRALALIVRKEIVQSYQALCLAAGLKLAAVTPRPFGIIAAAREAMKTGGALTPPPEPANAACAVVTVGDKWAEFCIFRDGTLVLARNLGVGATLAGEIRRNLTVYNGQTPARPVHALYLFPGPNADLRAKLGEFIDVPIYPFDPFAGNDVEVSGNPGGFAGATGMLFAQAERGRLPVNFVDPRKAVAAPNPYTGRIIAAAAVVLIIFAALFITGRHVLGNMEREADLREAEKAILEKKVTAVKEDGKRFKALDEWNTVVWLDELYELTAMMDVSQLRVTQLTAAPITNTGKKTSPYTARLTIEIELVNPQRGRQALDAFTAQFRSPDEREFYLLEGPPESKSDGKYVFTIKIRKRAPDAYKRKIAAAPEK